MKHWVFDLDGTLVDSLSHYFAILQDIFAEHGLTLSHENLRSSISQPIPGFLTTHLGAQNLPAALAVLQKRSEEDAARIQPFDGVLEILTHLQSKGSRLAMWTNRDFESAQLILKSSGLAPFFEVCVSGSCGFGHKPNPDGFGRIEDLFLCEKDTVILVGDHETDMLAAKALGIKAIRASWHSYWKSDSCAHADHQFYKVNDFRTWVFQNMP
jgi:HAD superfamily hydrolase (TIGR01509 family)